MVEDLGIRLLNYGNAAGGVFSGPYRSILIEVSGENQIVSFGVSTYNTDAKPDIAKTSLNVAIDTDKSAHHALQLVVDDNIKITGDMVSLYHSGKIAIGNIGSGKIEELKNITQQIYPELLQDNKFYLGGFVNNKLCTIEDKEIEEIIENLISYALIRDIYRAEVKNRRLPQKDMRHKQ